MRLSIVAACQCVALPSSDNEASPALISAINTAGINHKSPVRSVNYTGEGGIVAKPGRCDAASSLMPDSEVKLVVVMSLSLTLD